MIDYSLSTKQFSESLIFTQSILFIDRNIDNIGFAGKNQKSNLWWLYVLAAGVFVIATVFIIIFIYKRRKKLNNDENQTNGSIDVSDELFAQEEFDGADPYDSDQFASIDNPLRDEPQNDDPFERDFTEDL